jgi:hypothetical protein
MRHRPLGSMLKDYLKIVANWLAKLLRFVPSSAVARVGIMSINCGLKENCGAFW